MEFVNDPYLLGETIAAIATPPGEGGVAVIRISGDDAVSVGNRVCSLDLSSFSTHTAHYGSVINADGQVIDQALFMPMLSPRSYTGEDTIEIFCHGGSLIVKEVLETVYSAGAKPAKPGEFTCRAFLNGKIDLTQAEAIQEMIAAKSDKALSSARDQLQGSLSKKVQSFQTQLTHLAAVLEAWVDFPEEGLEFMSFDELTRQIHQVEQMIASLLATFNEGRIVHDGLTICLVGCPNVGKSSLMNALLDRERAIVSDVPGTTRDFLEDQLQLNGLYVRLIDTAGIHESTEAIEAEGIRRSRKAMDEADLILMVLDASEGLRPLDESLLNTIPKEKALAIWNKTDLPHQALPKLDLPHVASVSAKFKHGIDELHKEVDRIIWKDGMPHHGEVMITKLRHRESLNEALQSLQNVRNGIQNGISAEFVTSDMRGALQSLGKIIGTNVTEDILSAIFSHFCVGK